MTVVIIVIVVAVAAAASAATAAATAAAASAAADCSYKKGKHFNEVSTTDCEQKASTKGNYLLTYSRG